MDLRAPADPEIKICGAHACQAVARRRREDIRRIYISEALIPEFSELLRWAAQERLAYHVVDDVELEKITRSVHHGGVALIVRQPPPPTLAALLHRLRGEDPETPRLLIYLDNVQNPHNVGAIVRVAAHFDADGVLIAGEGTGMSTAMARTAEGGAEAVDVVPVALGQRPLLAAREAGFTLIATTSHGERSIYSGDGMPARALIMLGSESHGLAPAVASLADLEVTIPGSGQVESLNVACATTALLAEHWRRYRETHGRAPMRAPGERTTPERARKPGRTSPARPGKPGRDAADRPPASRAGKTSAGDRAPRPRGRDQDGDRPERPERRGKPERREDRPRQAAGADRPERSERASRPEDRPSRPRAAGNTPGNKPGKGPARPKAGGRGKPGAAKSATPGKGRPGGKPGKSGKPGGKFGKPSKGRGKPSGSGKSRPAKS